MLERDEETKNICRSAFGRLVRASVATWGSHVLRGVVLFFAGFSSTGYAGVVVVDAANGPGADFTQLAPVIAAASSGDTVLIRPGNYSGSFTIDGKSLDLVGAPNATVPAIGPLVVKNLATGQRVLLQSLEFTAANSFMLPTKTLTATNCAGHLTLDRCRIALGSDDLVLDHCQEVVISRSEIVGADQFLAFFFEIPTGAGLRVTGSRVAIHDSLLIGGNGSQGAEGFAFDELVPSGSGAPALRVSGDSELSIVGSQLQGGNGGDGFFAPIFGACFPPGEGASALVVDDLSSTVRLLATTFAPGVEGIAASGCPQPGTIAPPIQGVGSGNVVLAPHVDRDATLDSPALEQQVTTFTLNGLAGDAVFLFVASTPAFQSLPGIESVLEPALPAQLLPFGSLPPSGNVTLPILLPNLPSGVEVARLFVQAAFADTSARITLAEPQAFVVFDSNP